MTTTTWATIKVASSTLLVPYPSGASQCPTSCEANAACG